MQLLERDGEISAIESALARTGTLVTVEGPAGIGKTGLLQHARAAAGVPVLAAHGAELEADFPFGVVRQLFEPALRRLTPEARAQALAGAAALAAPLVAPADAPALRAPTDPTFAALHGLYWLTSNLGPLVMTVDDAHWADPPSLRFLAYLARRVADLPVVLIVGLRAETENAREAAAIALAALRAVPDRVALRPAALSPAAVVHLVEAGLGATPDAAFARACARATGGTPFLVRELVAALHGVAPVAAEAPRVSALGPDAVARAVGDRLARLGRDATSLAESVAALGEQATAHRAATLAGLDADAGTAARDALVAAGLLTPTAPGDRQAGALAYVHPILRAAVYGALPPGRRSALHARAARLLGDEGAEADAIGAQLLATEPGGRPEVTAFLRDAAADAARRGGVDSAIVYLRRALDEGAGARGPILHELGIAARLLRWPAALEYLEQAHELTGDPEIGLDLAMTLIYANRWDDAVALIEPALTTTTGATAIRAHTYWAAAAAYDPLRSGELERRLPELRGIVAGGGPPARSLALLLACRMATTATDLAAVGALVEQGLDGGAFVAEESAEAWAVVQAVWALCSLGELDRADRLAGDILADGYERASPLSITIGTLTEAWIACARGDLLRAESMVRSAVQMTLEYNLAFGVPSVLFYAQEVILERPGCDDIAALALELELPPDIARTVTGAFVAQVTGRIKLQRGDRDGGAADLRRCGEIRSALGMINPAECPWRSQLAMATGDAPLAAAELADAERVGSPRAIGAALWALGRIEADPGRLQDAVDVLAGAGAPLEHARALVDLGTLLRRGGRRSAAREPLRLALDLAERCGATRLAEHARTELGATGAHPRRRRLTGAEALTASERRVAELAAAGRSNPEIAQALFISRNTVQTHLRHVYEKLRIASREDLAAALRRD